MTFACQKTLLHLVLFQIYFQNTEHIRSMPTFLCSAPPGALQGSRAPSKIADSSSSIECGPNGLYKPIRHRFLTGNDSVFDVLDDGGSRIHNLASDRGRL